MIVSVKNLFARLGIDGAIAYTVLGRVVQAGGGVVSLLFIAKYLTDVEQGYYFTFGSILAIQIFFELGLSNIITQFVAHETAHLKWKSSTELIGSDESISRLSSLLRFCVRWFAILAFLLFFILLLVGFIFFNKYKSAALSTRWEIPWGLLSISTASSLVVSPILAFCEGLGKVKEVAIIRVIQQTFQLLLLLLFLTLGFKLMAGPLASVLSFVVAPVYIFCSYKRKLLQYIWNQLGESTVNYKLEIFPYQWRIALSWISGYFIFQLFNPVLFATEGSETAGQMGMTLAALNGILAISLSWTNTKVPLFSHLIANLDYKNLDIIFVKTLKQASVICIICLGILIIVVTGLRKLNIPLGARFLPNLPFFLLCVATFVNQFISGIATYLRCHKQEPFLIQSIVMGVLTCTSTLIFGKYFGVNGIVIGYCSLLVFVSMIWSLIIFKKKRKLWH